jgi:signal transduction histidine kinase/ActR/RegA family two-component response regulator
MHWNDANIVLFYVGHVSQAAVDLSFALLLAILFRLKRDEFLRLWSWSWAALCAFHLAIAGAAYARSAGLELGHPSRVVIASLAIVAGFAHALLTALGAAAVMRGQRLRLPMLGVAFVAITLIAAGLVFASIHVAGEVRTLLRIGIRDLLVGSAFVATAWTQWLRRGRGQGGALLCALSFGVYGMLQLGYFGMHVTQTLSEWSWHFGGITVPLDVLLEITMGVGMVVSLFDEERRRAQDTGEVLKRTEETLRQAHKMEAVGRLAGGIAHDFNNALTGIMGYTELLASALDEKSNARDFARGIKDSASKAKALVQRLLAFSRKQVLQPRVINLNSVVTDVVEMLKRLIGEDVHLVVDLDRGLDNTIADPNQIQQALMNLAVNARDAMPGGGTLTISTRHVELRRAADLPHAHGVVESGGYVMVAVTDTGSGMDESTRQRIFEPFFTTKDEGTGLGLAMVYGIVRQSHGAITVESEPGRGASFRLYFKATPSQIAPSRAPAARSELARGGGECVLVVEDEPAIREVIGRTLVGLGYDVILAEDGETAIAMAQQHPERFRLLVTDVVMPGMNGPELARRMLALTPGLRVLFMSGYSGDLPGREALESGAYLQKPFEPQVLALRVRETLDASERPMRAPDTAVAAFRSL